MKEEIEKRMPMSAWPTMECLELLGRMCVWAAWLMSWEVPLVTACICLTVRGSRAGARRAAEASAGAAVPEGWCRAGMARARGGVACVYR